MPRIKASNWTPDIYRDEDFYLSDHWLGAAWKAMPADLSHDRLGRRVLDLLDDMANWGHGSTCSARSTSSRSTTPTSSTAT